MTSDQVDTHATLSQITVWAAKGMPDGVILWQDPNRNAAGPA